MKEKQKESQDPGLGTSYRQSVNRFLNADGSFNIHRIGAVSGYRDVYKYLIDLKPYQFFGFLLFAFLFINVVFAVVYLMIGVHHLTGIYNGNHPFFSAFYFSAQTFTTVGYGAISPKGNLTSFVAAFEAFLGLIAFAVATGLIYGRFSKPSAKIGFSHNVILTPHKDGLALMFKMVNKRNSVLLNTQVEVMVTLSKPNIKTHQFERNYYNLPIEVNSVKFFPLTWTIVHQITEESPLFGLTIEELKSRHAEVLILVEAFDETYSQKVLQKYSYGDDQWKDQVKFKRSFYANEEGKIVLNIKELSELEPLEPTN